MSFSSNVLVSAQVSHHPPAAAHHVISQRGWTLWQEITIASKFRGKYLSIMPLGKPFQTFKVYNLFKNKSHHIYACNRVVTNKYMKLNIKCTVINILA